MSNEKLQKFINKLTRLWRKDNSSTWIDEYIKMSPECDEISVCYCYCPGDFFAYGPKVRFGYECDNENIGCKECWRGLYLDYD